MQRSFALTLRLCANFAPLREIKRLCVKLLPENTKPPMNSSTKKIFLQFVFICTFSLLHNRSSSQDSSRLRISLLTCTPGEELYSTFGHSALRVIDSNSLNDIVYNYGTFNFNDDGFYLKFIRGKLMYYVSTENYRDFKYTYQIDNRGITEQVLNLNPAEKISIRNFLNENCKEANKYYKYDFFFDNCTSRLRDILKNQHDSGFCHKAVMPAGSKFRKAIHEYLDNNGKDWSKLGIDILLGRRCDAVMTAEQMQFLPDNLMKSLDSCNTGHHLVWSESIVLRANDTLVKRPLLTPLLFFSLLLALIIALGFVQNKIVQNLLQGFDGLLFFLTGSLGMLLILMWTCSDHIMCRDNFNLLWAWPTHFFMAFFVNSKKAWVRKYFAFTAIILVLVLLSWFFLPQQMNNALIPFILLLIYRGAIKYMNRYPAH